MNQPDTKRRRKTKLSTSRLSASVLPALATRVGRLLLPADPTALYTKLVDGEATDAPPDYESGDSAGDSDNECIGVESEDLSDSGQDSSDDSTGEEDSEEELIEEDDSDSDSDSDSDTDSNSDSDSDSEIAIVKVEESPEFSNYLDSIVSLVPVKKVPAAGPSN